VKEEKYVPTTYGKITSKFYVTSCVIMVVKPSNMKSLILGMLLVARKLIQIIRTRNIVSSFASSFTRYSY